MGFDLAAASAILKDNYLPPVVEQLNLSTPLLAELQRNTEDFVGDQAVFPLHVGRAESVGARADGGNLPAAGKQKYVKATLDMSYQYARIAVTLPTIEKTKSDSGSFIRAVDAETKGAMAELKEDFSRQLSRNDASGTGTLAQVEGAHTSATVINIKNPTRVTWRILRKDMAIEFNGTNARTITAVDKTAETITVDSAVTVADLAVITRKESKDNELFGIDGLISATGTVHGVNSSTYDTWKSTVNANGGTSRALSEDLMQQVVDDIGEECGEEPDFILANRVQRRKFVGMLESRRRIVNELELKGGFKGVAFNDSTPIVVDRFTDPDRMLFLNRNYIQLFELTDWKWADHDGAILRNVAGKAEFEAFLYKYCQLGVNRRNAHGKLVDLAS